MGKRGYRLAPDSGDTLIAHALTAGGHDGSDDGSGRGTPLVAAPLSHGSNPNSNAAGRRREDDENLVAYALRADPGGTGQGHNTTYVAETLRSYPRPGSNSDGQLVTSFDWQVAGSDRTWIHDRPGGPTRSLTSQKTLAVHVTQDPVVGEVAPAMGTGNRKGCATMGVHEGVRVRRLTPVECERLQGLPDGWTELPGTKDSPRYAALGDAVTATVSEWIGRRIIAADS